MKVGIITKHSVPNYGAMLQAYALCTYLRNQGHDTELIDYDQPATTEYYRYKWQFPPLFNHWLRLQRAARFVRNRQVRSARHCTSVAEFSDFSRDYTHLITGSDQVWFTGPVQYYDPMYFLDFPFEHGTKISYAPSAGGIDSFGEFSDKVRQALARFGHISVRDANTFRLVSDLIGKPPTLVSDPTLLHDFMDLVDPAPPLAEPYILLFGRIPDAYHRLITEAAVKQGVKQIVSLQYPNAIATKRIAAPSPEDWLRYFYHATKVVTSYFHGTVFALKFHKPFISIPTDGRIKKVTALLEDTGLMHRYFTARPDPAAFNQQWSDDVNWREVDRKIGERVAQSTRFLQTALAPKLG